MFPTSVAPTAAQATVETGIPWYAQPPEDDPQPAMNWKAPIPGLTGDIAYFIYNNAHKQNPEVAIAGALALMAGICGRTYNFNRTGLNQYFVLLGLSGQGKEDAEKGIRKILTALLADGVGSQQLDSIVGPSQIASAPGLVNQLRDTPCFLTIIGEFGKLLDRLCSKYAKSNEIGINSLLLDLYSRSGSGDILGTSAYSDKAKNGTIIQAPCLSILGNSTQHAFYKAISEDNVTEGLVSRFTVIECADDHYIESNHSPKPEPSAYLIKQLSQLIHICRRDLINAISVDTTAEVKTRFIEIDKTYGKLAYDNRDKPYMAVYHRVALITMKTAALLAVGVNPYMPCITQVEFDWAEMFANNSVQTIIRRFAAGKVGENNSHIDQHEQLLNCLRKYRLKAWQSNFEPNYGITAGFKAMHIITYRYIHNMLHKQPAFRNAPNPKMALDNIIDEFTKSDSLIKISNQDKARHKIHSRAEMWFVNNLIE